MTALFMAQLRYVNEQAQFHSGGTDSFGESGMDAMDAATYILHSVCPNVDDYDDDDDYDQSTALYEIVNSDPLFRSAVNAGGACMEIRAAISEIDSE
jgi:hypothetical protein